MAFGTLMINLPSEVDGGQLTVFDPSFYDERAAPSASIAALSAARGGGTTTGDYGNHHMVFGSTGNAEALCQ